MKTIDQLNKQIVELTQERDSQLAQEKELKETQYQKIIHKNKEFRIYVWENKPFKDFPMPKGFDFAEAKDVDELVNLEKFKPKQGKWYVFKQRYPKINKDYGLSGLYLDGNLDLWSDSGNLASSDSGGRVIISKVIE